MAATDERAIHEFPTGTIDDNSLLIMDRPTATPGEYETEKFAIANLGLKLLGGIDFPNNLDTDEQDIFGAINEVNSKAMNIAEEYDETDSYSKGDYCIYQNAAYRCIKASGTTTGTFVAADWTQIKVLTEVKANTDAIDELNTNKQDNLKQYDATITTDSGGFFSVTLNNPYKVLSAWADQGDTIIIPFSKTGLNAGGNITWWFRVTNENMAPQTNWIKDIHFLYID